MPISKTINQDFFKMWSPEMAYVLGYFAADGCMVANNRGGKYIEFTSTDRRLLSIVKEATHASQKISGRPIRNPNCKAQYRIQIGCKEWFSDLEKSGFQCAKSSILNFPDVPDRFVAEFVRGYFDGDGCVYFKNLKYADRKRKRWILMTLFTSGSRKFLDSLWEILKQKGVQGGTIQPKTRGFELKLSHRDSLALYEFMYNTASTTGLYLPRKRKLFTKAIKTLYPDAAVV